MHENLQSLSNQELRNLFLNESQKFIVGMDDGFTFDDLKQIRIHLREIAVELTKRNAIKSDGEEAV